MMSRVVIRRKTFNRILTLLILVFIITLTKAKPRHRVHYGTKVSLRELQQQFPFLVSLKTCDGQRCFYCTGGMVSPEVVLTAGHCFCRFDKGVKTTTKVKLNASSVFANGLSVFVRKRIIHPGYQTICDESKAVTVLIQILRKLPLRFPVNQTVKAQVKNLKSLSELHDRESMTPYDVAMSIRKIKISQDDLALLKLKGNQHINITCVMESHSSKVEIGSPVLFVGFGLTEQQVYGHLNKAWSQTVPCDDQSQDFICAADLEKGQVRIDTGDSGGPLLMLKNRSYVLVGVNTGTRRHLHERTLLSMFTTIHRHSPWIKKTIKALDDADYDSKNVCKSFGLW